MRLILSAAVISLLMAPASATAPRAIVMARAVADPVIGGSPGNVTLHDQNSNSAGYGVSSQNFESPYASYDDQGADDFTVPSGHRWTVTEVDVTGSFSTGPQPSATENVFIYRDAGGLPGTVVSQCSNIAGKGNGTGSFTIKIPTACRIKLNTGTYWVSVQINLEFACCGEWSWEANAVQNGDASAWQNPGGGFGVCPTWGTTESCLGDTGPDYMFALKGRDK